MWLTHHDPRCAGKLKLLFLIVPDHNKVFKPDVLTFILLTPLPQLLVASCLLNEPFGLPLWVTGLGFPLRT